MNAQVAAQLEVLPTYLGSHLVITVVPLLIGVALSVPLGIAASRHPRWRTGVLGVVSVIQTIPGLALLALMVPVLAWIDAAAWFEVPALGFLPAAVALTLYSMLPMVRNTVTGITGVDDALIEAARGIGMTEGQVLREVQLPLAAPVILAGVRTATVWCVGMATLATPVGQTCLGNYIFGGLQTRNWTAVLFGCVAAAVLAVVLDGLVGLLERAADRRSRPLASLAGGLLVAVLGAGLAAPRLFGPSAGEDAVVVGAKSFTEQYLLAEVIAGRLREAGVPVQKREGLGSTIAFDGLVEGEIDVYVDYSGTIWANQMERTDHPGAGQVLEEMRAWLRSVHGVTSLGPLGFENAYALAMGEDRAASLGVEALPDLAPHAPDLVIGGDYEFFQRPEWIAVREAYDLRFAAKRTLDQAFLYEAAAKGEADVISAFSSDGRIAAYDLRVLADPAQALPPYDAVLLLSSDAAGRSAVVDALRPLVRSIDVDTMREANARVDAEDQTLAAAATWLDQAIRSEASSP